MAKAKRKRGRPKSKNPKLRVHITIEPDMIDIADKYGRSNFFGAAAEVFVKTPQFRKFKLEFME